MSFDSSLKDEKKSTEFAIVLDPNKQIDDLFERESNSVKVFPFKLDSFQMQAILHLELHSNVFVSAHTSAGKTVVAEYAIAMAFKSQSRVIYTSPIKALSNQKYRDFKLEFKDVGLLTGDVQIDSEAKCLVMTTEILLQMLYNSSEVINDLEWVVFDECHYVNDPERGHVWEEVFILLPPKVNLLLLSATVPNVVQFADWLGRARNKKTYVVSTSKRPVPLQHYLYVGRDAKSKDNRFKILDSSGKFLEENYKQTELFITERKGKLGFIKKSPQTERNIYINLIRHLSENNKLPVICFTLSRQRCDTNLENLMSIESLKLTTRAEEAHIHHFIWNHLRKLKDCDQKLPQIIRTVEMLKKGFGVHHSGILPILKEITEILFCDGFVKVLFATETFAMGVNMPARSVVFDSIEKHDGNKFRDLKASEYIQMAGRAGRRGKDKTGTVIILCKYDIPDSYRLLKIMQGSASELVSQFRLTYHMIVNLHKTSRNEQKDIENFLERSFGEHNRLKQSLEDNTRLRVLQTKVEDFPSLECVICCEDIEKFYNTFVEYQNVCHLVMPTICSKAQEKGRLNSGRIVAIVGNHNPFELAVILKVIKGKNNEMLGLTTLSLTDENGFEYKNIELKSVHKILNKQFHKKFDPKPVIAENENPKNKNGFKEETMSAIEYLKQLCIENDYRIMEMESIDPKKNLQLKEINFIGNYNKFEELGQRLLSYNCIQCKYFVKHFQTIKEKMQIVNQMTECQYKLSSESLQFLPEYQSRVKVLQEMEYLNKELVLELKGRVACLMSEHELVITEMLMNNVIGDMSPQEIAALFSCFVFQQKTNTEPNLTDTLKQKKEELESIALYISNVQNECRVPDELDLLGSLKFGLVEVVYQWANGKPFVEILALTEVQEGIIVRCIQRLEELLKFVKMAAKLIGNNELEERIESASQAIRRDIVFFPSLYTIPETQTVDKENEETLDEDLSSNFL